MKKILLAAALFSISSYAGVCTLEKDVLVVRAGAFNTEKKEIKFRSHENSSIRDCISYAQILLAESFEHAKSDKDYANSRILSVEVFYTFSENMNKYTGSLKLNKTADEI